MGFAQTADSFVKLLDAAPKPPVAPTKKLDKVYSKTFKSATRVKGERKIHEFKIPENVTKLASRGSLSKEATLAFMAAKVAHIAEVAKAFAALSPEDKRKLSTLAHATDKTSLSKVHKATVHSRGLAGATADSLKKGLALAKAQKINLDSATW